MTHIFKQSVTPKIDIPYWIYAHQHYRINPHKSRGIFTHTIART